MTDDDILYLWSPPLPGAAVQRPILGRNKIIAFGRAVADAASAQERARAERLASFADRLAAAEEILRNHTATNYTLDFREDIEQTAELLREVRAALDAEPEKP